MKPFEDIKNWTKVSEYCYRYFIGDDYYFELIIVSNHSYDIDEVKNSIADLDKVIKFNDCNSFERYSREKHKLVSDCMNNINDYFSHRFRNKMFYYATKFELKNDGYSEHLSRKWLF